MTVLPDTSHPAMITMTRVALGVLAVLVVLGEVVIAVSAASSAQAYPEFAYLQVPFVIAALAFGVCVEVALIVTAVLVGYTRDRRIFEPVALRLVDYLTSAIAVATIIVVAVLVAIPGPPALALLLLAGVAVGAAFVLVLLVLRSLLRSAVSMRVELDEVV